MTGLEAQRGFGGVERMTGLGGLFAPRGIAVIGASRNPVKLGSVMARSLSSYGGPLALVNSRDPGMHGSVAEAVDVLGAPIDLAVVCVPAPACADAVAEAAKAGATAALVCAGGFAESGHEDHQQALADVVERYGIRLLGPNTSGFLVPKSKLTASFVPSAAQVPAGGVAVVAASGGVNHAVSFLLAEAGYGVSIAVGLGNSVDLGTAEILDHLLDHADTTAVALHVESVADGSRLADSVARLSVRIPVVALVVGRNDVGDFARSHTGSLATSWRTTRGVLRQAGAVLVDDERQLVDAVGALSTVRLPPSADPGVGIVTAQAGPGLLLLDRLRDGEIRIPMLAGSTRERLGELLPPMTYQENPVDTGRPGPEFGDVVGAVAADESVELVAVYALTEPDNLDLVSELSRVGDTGPTVVGVGGSSEDVAVVRAGLRDRGYAVGTSPAAVANAVRALVDDARTAHRGTQGDVHALADDARTAHRRTQGDVHALAEDARTAHRRTYVPGEPEAAGAEARAGLEDARTAHRLPQAPNDPQPAVPQDPARGLVGGPWDEDEAKGVLDGLGIRTPARVRCESIDAAFDALVEFGGPVAVKLLDASVLHKTEIGGVHLGIQSRDELADALEQLERAGAQRFLMEAMAAPGVDLIVGARRDPVFGPVVLVGLGGAAAEALADVAVRAVPLSMAEAESMPDELLGRALLDGWRNGPVLDRSELARMVRALGQVLIDTPNVDEIEINPLRLTRDGLVALDAVITANDAHDRASGREEM